MRRILAGLALALAVQAAAAAAAHGLTVHTVDEKALEGKLLSLDEKGRLRLELADGGTAEIDAPDVIRVDLSEPRASAPPPDRTEFVLQNGDRLFGSIEAVVDADGNPVEQGQALRVHVRSLGALLFPSFDLFRWIRFPSGRTKVLAVEAKGQDYVFRSNGDRISGSVESFARTGVIVERRGDLTTVPFDELDAIYVPPLYDVELPARLYAVFRLRDGSQVTGFLRSYAGGVFAFELLSGVPTSIAEEEVVSFSFRNGNFVYLSDLRPETVREIATPFQPVKTLRPPYPARGTANYRPDRSYGGRPLTLGGRVYPKGVGSHSWCELTYRLDGAYARFRAVVGIDDEALGKPVVGDVIFRVLLDGKEAFSSGVMRAGQEPRRISLDVSGAEALVLVVDYAGDVLRAEDLDSLDRADWADALLTRKKK